MWNINPKLLCDKHLLGEHFEMHLFAGNIRKGRSIKGYIINGLVEVHNINNRHKVLADELLRRGFKHKIPLKIIKSRGGSVDIKRSINDLVKRCSECRKRINSK